MKMDRRVRFQSKLGWVLGLFSLFLMSVTVARADNGKPIDLSQTGRKKTSLTAKSKMTKAQEAAEFKKAVLLQRLRQKKIDQNQSLLQKKFLLDLLERQKTLEDRVELLEQKLGRTEDARLQMRMNQSNPTAMIGDAQINNKVHRDAQELEKRMNLRHKVKSQQVLRWQEEGEV